MSMFIHGDTNNPLLGEQSGVFQNEPNELETHGCVFSTVATDALVLKHQALSIQSADETFNVLGWFHAKILHL